MTGRVASFYLRADGEFIQTVPRRGYRFVAPVEERQDTRSDGLIHRRTTVRVVAEEGAAGGTRISRPRRATGDPED
ncbi:MAG: hypothetical protein ACRD1S_08955 [Vicinamibacterales bacterium]